MPAIFMRKIMHRSRARRLMQVNRSRGPRGGARRLPGDIDGRQRRRVRTA